MIQDIKKYFFFKRLKKEADNNKKQVLLKDFSQLRTVGIAYDASDYEMITTVRDLEIKLKHDGKNVSVFAFINSEEKKFEPFLFTKKDLNWYGYPKKPQLFNFAAQDFDIVFGFFNDIDSPLNAIFANSKSKIRLGIDYNQDAQLFDLILGTRKVQRKKDIVNILVNFITTIKTQ